MGLTLHRALLAVSVALAAVSMRLYVRTPRFFDFCIAVQTEPFPRLLLWSFLVLLGGAVLQLVLAWAGGALTPAENDRVIQKLKNLTITLVFEFAIVNFQGFGSVLSFVVVVACAYIAAYFNEKVAAFSTSAQLPSAERHQNLFFMQASALLAMVYMMAVSCRHLPLLPLFHVLGALITSALSILLDTIRHVTFLFDHEQLGASVEAYRVTFIAECATTILEGIVSFCFLVCIFGHSAFSYYYLRTLYDTVLKLPATLKKWQTWMRMRRMIEQMPAADTEDLAHEEMCIVCRVPMEVGEGRRLPCGHCFHADCIERWVGQQAECPLCKCDLSAALAEAERKLAEAEAAAALAEEPAGPTVFRYDDLIGGKAA